MITSKQRQEQLSVFYSKPIFQNCKFQLLNSAADHSNYKDKIDKRSNLKRVSCHNISRSQTVHNETSAQKPCFNNKILEHILGNVKQAFKNHYKQKEQKDNNSNIKLNKNQQTARILEQNILNCQNNLKIKSINNIIQRKIKTETSNRTAKIPFQNKKLVNLRKGRSYTNYTQDMEHEPNQNRILPWEQSQTNITKLYGAAIETQQEMLEQIYLKSHNIKLKQSQNFTKYNTITFQLNQTSARSPQKLKVMENNQKKLHRQSYCPTQQIFAPHCMKQKKYPNPRNKKSRNEQANRTLTQMKVECQEINFSKNHQPYAKNIRVQQFFQYNPPNLARKRHSNHHPIKIIQSFKKNLGQTVSNTFLMSGKKL